MGTVPKKENGNTPEWFTTYIQNNPDNFLDFQKASKMDVPETTPLDVAKQVKRAYDEKLSLFESYALRITVMVFALAFVVAGIFLFYKQNATQILNKA